MLEDIVDTSDKQRFIISDDATRIRANQGHSISVDLTLAPQRPPATLLHGTASRFVDAIRAQGLLPRSRQSVHLSADQATALKVGARHGKPVMLEVDALAMHEAGHVFTCAANGAWLTAAVPPCFIRFP